MGPLWAIHPVTQASKASSRETSCDSTLGTGISKLAEGNICMNAGARSEATQYVSLRTRARPARRSAASCSKRGVHVGRESPNLVLKLLFPRLVSLEAGNAIRVSR